MSYNTDPMLKNITDVNNVYKFSGKSYAPFRILKRKPLMEVQLHKKYK